MKTIAVIAEFDPFHSGHAYLIREAAARASADHVLILMSGDFVQRGEPAAFDKYVRTEMALRAGAGLVLELPVAAAAGSARRFAEGAAAILSRLGVVDELWFGSETGQIGPFETAGSLLADEPAAYRERLQEGLSSGLTFPAAREAALRQLDAPESVLSLLRRPNDTLGLEYCLALRRISSDIRPQTLLRAGDSPHDGPLVPGAFSSASSIRRHLAGGGALEALHGCVPDELLPLYEKALSDHAPVCADDLTDMLRYQLLKEDLPSLTSYLDLPADLASRILKYRSACTSFSSFCDLLKTRERTRTQVSRALLHLLLGITPSDMRRVLSPDYVRLLGFSRTAGPLLSAIRQKGQIRLVSKASALSAHSYDRDLFASELYETVCSAKSGRPFVPEYSRPVIVTQN